VVPDKGSFLGCGEKGEKRHLKSGKKIRRKPSRIWVGANLKTSRSIGSVGGCRKTFLARWKLSLLIAWGF